jgi:hypothetical protein
LISCLVSRGCQECYKRLWLIGWDDLLLGSVAMLSLISAVVAALAAFALAGCLSTQEMPLAPNVVRIDTQTGGWLFTGQTVPATMRAAAKATLDRGYSHFKFTDERERTGGSGIL